MVRLRHIWQAEQDQLIEHSINFTPEEEERVKSLLHPEYLTCEGSSDVSTAWNALFKKV
jgi:hypothetical protein